MFCSEVKEVAENKIVAATCKCSALRLKKLVLALSDFSDKIN